MFNNQKFQNFFFWINVVLTVVNFILLNVSGKIPQLLSLKPFYLFMTIYCGILTIIWYFVFLPKGEENNL